MQKPNQKKTTRRKCDQCTCDLGQPSPKAIERVHSIQAIIAEGQKGKRKNMALQVTEGCDWYVMSAEHGYCFWEYARTIDEPVPDKEICRLLGISQNQLRDTYNSAIKKLKESREDPVVKEFVETVVEFIKSQKNDASYMHDDYKHIIDSIPTAGESDNPEPRKESEEDIIEEIDSLKNGKVKKTRGRKKKTGMPLHRDGKKVDLFGLYKDKDKQVQLRDDFIKKEKKKRRKRK